MNCKIVPPFRGHTKNVLLGIVVVTSNMEGNTLMCVYKCI